MAENIPKTRTSLALFKYLCQHITGDENAVKFKRLLNSVKDRLLSNKIHTRIISGSRGEGLELKGSDIDIMEVWHVIKVHMNPLERFNTADVNVCTDIENAKPGFSYLRCIGHLIPNGLYTRIDCDNYMSSEGVKQNMIDILNYQFNKIHGPCITDEGGEYDWACCLHSRTWIYCALDWIKRATTWPNVVIKQLVVDHGVLFVPIGNTLTNYADINWRISFSVAEKILITSFSHTQLVCYSLCKILLKDVIEKDENCKGLLCSYHLKTILFWISEEQTLAFWRPDNLITCVLKCLHRLIYCVQIGSCPHYFLPEVNLFNKIGKLEQISLLKNLNTLISQGWRCLLLSEQLSSFNVLSTTSEKKETCHVDYFSHLIRSKTFTFYETNDLKNLRFNTIHYVCNFKLNRIKELYIYVYLSVTDKHRSLTTDFLKIKENKVYYKQYKMFISNILYLSTDAVSEWLLLALCFQKIKQYHKALHILSYVVTKFTPDKIYKRTFYEPIQMTDAHTDWMLSKTMQQKGIIHAIKTKFIKDLECWGEMFDLLPEDIDGIMTHRDGTVLFPPLVFTHFLRILCQTKLNNYSEARDTFKDLNLTTKNKSFIQGTHDETMSLYLLLKSAKQVGYELNDASEAMLASFRVVQKKITFFS